MKKQKEYVVIMTNTNTRLNPTHFGWYMKKIIDRRPCKTQEISEAQKFSTKAEAREALRNIRKAELYHTDIEIALVQQG